MVAIRGHARNWGGVVAAGVVTVVFFGASGWAAWTYLKPREPNISGGGWPEAPYRSQYAKGEACDPNKLQLLARHERQRTEDRCKRDEAQAKANAESLQASVRSAKAAEEAVRVSYLQAVVGFWQTFATFWAFVAAGIAAVFAGIAAYHTKRSADADNDALAEARKSAVAQTELNERQLKLLGLQADIQSKQHQIGRMQFLATHRPQITVHGVEYISVPTGDGTGREVFGIKIVCFNVGTNSATRVEARGHIVFMWQNNLPVDLLRPVVAEFGSVAPGGKIGFAVVSDYMIADVVDNGPPAICVGQIVYWDEANVTRETGFCFLLRKSHLPSWDSSDWPEQVYEY